MKKRRKFRCNSIRAVLGILYKFVGVVGGIEVIIGSIRIGADPMVEWSCIFCAGRRICALNIHDYWLGTRMRLSDSRISNFIGSHKDKSELDRRLAQEDLLREVSPSFLPSLPTPTTPLTPYSRTFS